MAFKKNNQSNTNKNLFVASLLSKKTGSTISWINLTDSFCKAVFKKELKNITAEEALATLPQLLGNDYVEVKITDTTAELVQISAFDY
jgi:hypothetical protein